MEKPVIADRFVTVRVVKPDGNLVGVRLAPGEKLKEGWKAVDMSKKAAAPVVPAAPAVVEKDKK
jgi:hypothetical protein